MAAQQTTSRSVLARGFTLIELLVVLGIIVVVVSFSIPAYNFITGNRSISSAENLVAAMIGRARSQAVSTQRLAGVAFFLNPATGRSTMAIVTERAPGAAGGEDPYPNYRGWSRRLGSGFNSGSTTQYNLGQEVIAPVIDPDENRVVIRRFRAKKDNPGSAPPSNEWEMVSSENVVTIDLIDEADLQPLPEGVGCQLINDPKQQEAPDRYVRTGAILFDGEGRLVSKEITIDRNGDLGQLLGLDILNEYIPYNLDHSFCSQLGLVLYDQEMFRSREFTEQDMIAAAGGSFKAIPNSKKEEQNEEQWLDQNALQLLVSRHTGTILKGE